MAICSGNWVRGLEQVPCHEGSATAFYSAGDARSHGLWGAGILTARAAGWALAERIRANTYRRFVTLSWRRRGPVAWLDPQSFGSNG